MGEDSLSEGLSAFDGRTSPAGLECSLPWALLFIPSLLSSGPQPESGQL